MGGMPQTSSRSEMPPASVRNATDYRWRGRPRLRSIGVDDATMAKSYRLTLRTWRPRPLTSRAIPATLVPLRMITQSSMQHSSRRSKSRGPALPARPRDQKCASPPMVHLQGTIRHAPQLVPSPWADVADRDARFQKSCVTYQNERSPLRGDQEFAMEPVPPPAPVGSGISGRWASAVGSSTRRDLPSKKAPCSIAS